MIYLNKIWIVTILATVGCSYAAEEVNGDNIDLIELYRRLSLEDNIINPCASVDYHVDRSFYLTLECNSTNYIKDVFKDIQLPQEFSFETVFRTEHPSMPAWYIARTSNVEDETLFSLVVDPRKETIEIEYTDSENNHHTLVYDDVFVFDNEWHKVVVSVTKHLIGLWVDCELKSSFGNNFAIAKSHKVVDYENDLFTIVQHVESGTTPIVGLQKMILNRNSMQPITEKCEETFKKVKPQKFHKETENQTKLYSLAAYQVAGGKIKGAKGSKGDKGLVGEMGPLGPIGMKGDPGDAGVQNIGDEGPPGEPGEKGAQGPPGHDGEKGSKGERGIPGPPGVTGPKGDKGFRGEPGEKGDPGDKGEQGEPGMPGMPGPPGMPGIKGDRGDPGDPGIPGPKGQKGLPGSIAPILEGIKGEKGDPGMPGLPGQPGIPGPQGFPGPPGQPGEVEYVLDKEKIKQICDKTAKEFAQHIATILLDKMARH